MIRQFIREFCIVTIRKTLAQGHILFFKAIILQTVQLLAITPTSVSSK